MKSLNDSCSYFFLVFFVFFISCSKDHQEKKLSSTESVKHVLDSIANEDSVALWRSLPQSYRSDINNLMHLMGEKMSPQVWDDSFTLVNRAGKVLQNKKALFVEMMETNLPSGMNKEQMEKSLQNFGEILSAIATSEVAKIETLKTIDLKNVAESSGKKILNLILNNDFINHAISQSPEIKAKNLKEALSQVKVEAVSENGNTAIVKVTGADGVVKENELLKVEDKWVEKQIAESFKSEIAKAREELEKISTTFKDNDARVSMVHVLVHGFLTSLENAKSVDDVKKSLDTMNINPLLIMATLSKMTPTFNQTTTTSTSKEEIDNNK